VKALSLTPSFVRLGLNGQTLQLIEEMCKLQTYNEQGFIVLVEEDHLEAAPDHLAISKKMVNFQRIYLSILRLKSQVP
jgi:hypothetical protein